MNSVGRAGGDQWAGRVEQGPPEGPNAVLLLVLQVDAGKCEQCGVGRWQMPLMGVEG